VAVTDWKIYALAGIYDLTPLCEWGVSIEETLGSPGTASFTLQDRDDMSQYPQAVGDFPSHFQDIGVNLEDLDVKIEIAGQSMPIFRGTVQRDVVDLPEMFPWRFHKISCTDYQLGIFGKRLVGTPNGYMWVGPDSDGNYIPVDPRVYLSGSDASVVGSLMNIAHAGIAGAISAVDVHEYVSYVDPLIGDPDNPQTPDRQTVGAVMDLMAGLAPGNVQYWIDPGLNLHYIAIPRWWEEPSDSAALAVGLPQDVHLLTTAPASIDNVSPDGVTTIGCRNLGWDMDYSQGISQWYVTGALGFIYLTGNQLGQVERNGNGWVSEGYNNSDPNPGFSQAFLDDPGVGDETTKMAAATRATNAVSRGILRGHCTVGNERHHVDGWHVGQLVNIRDDRMPWYLNGRYFVIQKVTTTLLPGVNWRVYDLEWGDAPIARSSTRRARQQKDLKLPGRLWDIDGRIQNPLPSSTVRVVGQLQDDMGFARGVAGVIVDLELHVWDADGNVVDGVGSISPETVTSDFMGRFWTDMTVGEQAGYYYCVCPKGSNSCVLVR
jgi:hypothetical protein